MKNTLTTFKQFQDSKIEMTTKEYVKEFHTEDVQGDKVLVYGGAHITDNEDGTYYVQYEMTEMDGTLLECEKALWYNFVEGEVNREYYKYNKLDALKRDLKLNIITLDEYRIEYLKEYTFILNK